MATLLVCAAAAAGCTTSGPEPGRVEPLAVRWQEVTLPVPPGFAGRLAVRDATTCAGQWYVVGGVIAAEGASRPAAWRSADGIDWTPLTFAPTTFWGAQDVLYAVGCRDGRIALIGAKSGGAHGNPRVSTWYAREDGVFADADASFELYGGPHAVNVGRIAGGPTGWVIVGNRTAGAAVWTSPDATEFRLIDDDPQLISNPDVDTVGLDLVFADGWTVVGNGAQTGRVARIPLAWVSADGQAWRREPVPYPDEYSDLQRVVPFRDGLLAVGARGDTFGAWFRAAEGWRSDGRFGSTKGAGSSFVSGLAVVGSGAVATATDGSVYSMWASLDGHGWRQVATPTAPRSGGDHVMTVAGSGDAVLLLADDATTGRAWLCRGCQLQ